MMYVACPKCDWHPRQSDQWSCACGHVWHTFETRGICPACGRIYEYTQCSAEYGCGQWSDHEDWYHDEHELTVGEYIADPGRVRE
jgi:hypothetical protein